MVASSFGTQVLWPEPVAAQGAQCAPGQIYSSAFGVCVEECWVDEGYDLESGTCVPVIPATAVPLVVAVETPPEPQPPATVVRMPFVWPQDEPPSQSESSPEPTPEPEAATVPEASVAPEPAEVLESAVERVQHAEPAAAPSAEPVPAAPSEPVSVEASGDDGVTALNPNHPCVKADRTPDGVTTNSELLDYAYLPGTDECVTLDEFNDRLDTFEEAAEAERAALEELRTVTEAMSELQGDFETVEARLVKARAAYRDAYERATDASALVKDTRKKLIETGELLDNEEELFARQALDSYMGGGDQEMIASLLPSLDAERNLGATMNYAEVVLEDRDATIERMEALRDDLAAQEVKYEEQKAKAQVELDAAHATKVDLEETLAEHQLLIDAMDLDIADADAVVAEFRNEKFETAHSIGVFAVESKQVEEILAEAQAKVEVGEPIEEAEPRDYIMPVDPPTHGSHFGPRMHPILGVMRNHDGLDFRAGQGQSIFATRGGTVVHADVMGGYGNTVLIDHGNGTASLYAHQSSIAVSYGQTVEQGEVIGYVGSTGMSTGPHLHFEIRENGTPVDPAPYLGL